MTEVDPPWDEGITGSSAGLGILELQAAKC